MVVMSIKDEREHPLQLCHLRSYPQYRPYRGSGFELSWSMVV